MFHSLSLTPRVANLRFGSGVSQQYETAKLERFFTESFSNARVARPATAQVLIPVSRDNQLQEQAFILYPLSQGGALLYSRESDTAIVLQKPHAVSPNLDKVTVIGSDQKPVSTTNFMALNNFNDKLEDLLAQGLTPAVPDEAVIRKTLNKLQTASRIEF